MIRSPGFRLRSAPALGDEVDPFGRAAHEDHLVGRAGADEAGDPPPRRLEGQGHLRRALVDAAMDGRIGFGIAARRSPRSPPAASAPSRRCRDRTSRPGSPGNRRHGRAGGALSLGGGSVRLRAAEARRTSPSRRPLPAKGRGFASRHRACERLAHRLLADPVDRVGDEGAGEQGLGLARRNAAAGEVEEGVAVELADGRAVGAFDVVGEDFELGLGVDRRAARQQQALAATARRRSSGRRARPRPGRRPSRSPGRRRPSARPGGWSRRARRGGRRDWRHGAGGRAPSRAPPASANARLAVQADLAVEPGVAAAGRRAWSASGSRLRRARRGRSG